MLNPQSVLHQCFMEKFYIFRFPEKNPSFLLKSTGWTTNLIIKGIPFPYMLQNTFVKSTLKKLNKIILFLNGRTIREGKQDNYIPLPCALFILKRRLQLVVMILPCCLALPLLLLLLLLLDSLHFLRSLALLLVLEQFFLLLQ